MDLKTARVEVFFLRIGSSDNNPRRATHGVPKIRGIPLADARALLTAAFCRAVLEELPLEALREHLSNLLIAQLPST